MIKSLWENTCEMPKFSELEKDENTDVLIVGGGMAGILCAYFLEKQGISYLLCEANTVAGGTTAKTTAVISAQHDTFYYDLAEKFGYEKAGMYLSANLDALNEYRNICGTIDCGFEEKPSYIYFCNNSENIEREIQCLKKLGFNAELVSEIPLPVKISGAIKFPFQAQFHPLKFISEICKNMNIREHSQIKKIKGNTAYTDKYKINADKIIIASHFPIINTHGMYYTKLYQKRSYIIALENAGQYNGTFVENRESGLYFRNYKNLLLIGGGDHRTGINGCNYEELRKFAREHYPNSKEKYAWATQDCMSLDGVPYIGKYSPQLENVYTASGFNEWGMTTSMVAAKILSDMVIGAYNKYLEIFNPSRNMITSQLFVNLGITLGNFITPTTKRCKHLGCALKWNKYEHSWDCPCHGSRFDENGKIINNPSVWDLTDRQKSHIRR